MTDQQILEEAITIGGKEYKGSGRATLYFQRWALIKGDDAEIDDNFSTLSELRDKILGSRALDIDTKHPIVVVTSAAWDKYESMLFDDDELREFVGHS